MSRLSTKETQSSLREFIKENESSVFCFCELMLHDKEEADWVVLKAFKEFGDFYRKKYQKSAKSEFKIRLFSTAWRLILRSQEEEPLKWLNGRDTRKMSDWEKNILSQWTSSHEMDESLKSGLLSRVRLLSIDFKAPLILKDILRFEDEEILQILGNRWGVYRHRLHRGRLELLQGLKGNAFTSGAQV